MRKARHESARQQLRAVGLRATPARISVLCVLSEVKRPLTHLEVSELVEESNIDKSTVFRLLQDFVSAGLARRMDVGDHTWRYERETPGTTSREQPIHPHLLCVECGTVICLGESDVQLHIPASVGAVDEIFLKGRCATCGETPFSAPENSNAWPLTRD